MTRGEAIDFLECRRAYYASLSTDPDPDVKATKVCGYTLAESANACLIVTEALEQESVLDKIRAEIEEMYRVILKGTPKDDWAVRWNDCVDEVLEIIDKYKAESEEV